MFSFQIGMAQLKKIVRISGTDIDGERKLGSSLHKIKGVDFMLGNAVLKVLGMDGSKKIGELTPEELKKIEHALKNPVDAGVPSFLVNRRRDPETGKDIHLISSDLVLRKDFDIKDMRKIKSYKGMRHAVGLKVRGQRTKSTGRRGSAVGVKRKKKGK